MEIKNVTRENVFAVLQNVPEMLEDGKKYTVEVREQKNHRSLEANAYAWVLLDKLSEKLFLPKEEIYKRLVKDIGGNNVIVCAKSDAVEDLIKNWGHNGLGWVCDTINSKIQGCTNVILYYGSSTYDVSQMHRLIELIVQECKQVGIETLTPEQIANLRYE